MTNYGPGPAAGYQANSESRESLWLVLIHEDGSSRKVEEAFEDRTHGPWRQNRNRIFPAVVRRLRERTAGEPLAEALRPRLPPIDWWEPLGLNGLRQRIRSIRVLSDRSLEPFHDQPDGKGQLEDAPGTYRTVAIDRVVSITKMDSSPQGVPIEELRTPKIRANGADPAQGM